MSDPQMKKRAEMLTRDSKPEYRNILSKVSAGAKGITATLGMLEGTTQKREAKKALEALREPTIPSEAKVDPALGRLASRAEARAISPERYGALSGYKQQIGQAYRGGIEQARVSSGGQSGAFGSSAQSLYNQRLQQAGQLPAITSQMSQQYDTLAGNLAGKNAQMQSYNYMNNLNRSQMQLGQYNTEAQAAAGLYGAGATNFYKSLNYGLDAMQQPLAQSIYGARKKTGIDPFDNQMEAVTNSMNTFFSEIPWADPYEAAPLSQLNPLPVSQY